jgi:sterol O-acyltransferase
MPLDIPAGAQPVPTRTSSGGFQTSEGTLYVSKPYRSRNSKKMKAVITFAPRNSRFDDEGSGANEFRVRSF